MVQVSVLHLGGLTENNETVVLFCKEEEQNVSGSNAFPRFLARMDGVGLE